LTEIDLSYIIENKPSMLSFAIAILRCSYFVVESKVEVFAPRKLKEWTSSLASPSKLNSSNCPVDMTFIYLMLNRKPAFLLVVCIFPRSRSRSFCWLQPELCRLYILSCWSVYILFSR